MRQGIKNYLAKVFFEIKQKVLYKIKSIQYNEYIQTKLFKGSIKMTNSNIKVDATVSFLNVIRGEKTTVSHNSNENFSLFDFWCYDFADADVDISTICNEYYPIVLPSKKVVNDVSSLKYVNMVSISVAALYHYNDFEEFTNLLNIQVSTDVGYGVKTSI